MELQLIGAASRARSVNVQPDYRMNLHVEIADNRVMSMYPRHGLQTWVNFGGSGGIRGQITAGGYDWVVAGNTLYRVAASGTYTSIGAVGGSGAVAMAENGTQIMIGCGSSLGYVVTIAAATIAQITDPDFVGADWVWFLDGFFLFGLTGSSQFYGTALYDATSIDALDFASAEGAPDSIVVGIVDHRELLLFGEGSTEGWRNTGANGFPWERMDGAFMEHGCAARLSAVKIDNSVFFVGQDDKGRGMVWRIDGYSPVRISTHAVETAIAGYSDISDAYAWSFQDAGHTYYVLTFPSANATWCYDCANQTWSPYGWRNPVTATQDRHRGANHVLFGGHHVVGDHSLPILYRMRADMFADAGEPISQIYRFPYPRSENKRVFIERTELVCETGIGLVIGQGSDPQAMLRISRDGGHTWGNERLVSLGEIGQYSKRAYWNRCGQGRQLVGEITVTDPVATAWIGISVQIEEGDS